MHCEEQLFKALEGSNCLYSKTHNKPVITMWAKRSVQVFGCSSTLNIRYLSHFKGETYGQTFSFTKSREQADPSGRAV